VLERLITGVKAIQEKVPFSRDDRLGWLTFCPTNLVNFLKELNGMRILTTLQLCKIPENFNYKVNLYHY
jgi:protein-arginine kinase